MPFHHRTIILADGRPVLLRNATPDDAFFSKALVDALLAPLALNFNSHGVLDNGDISDFITRFLAEI